MDGHPLARLSALVVAGALTNGCIALTLGTEEESPDFSIDGPGSGYATLGDLPAYRGEIVKLAALRGGERTGELAAVDVWPLLGLDVGVLGARVRLFNVEAGAGTLWYQPQPTSVWGDATTTFDLD